MTAPEVPSSAPGPVPTAELVFSGRQQLSPLPSPWPGVVVTLAAIGGLLYAARLGTFQGAPWWALPGAIVLASDPTSLFRLLALRRKE